MTTAPPRMIKMLEPKLMLFDEVTSALDIELVNEVLLLMKTLANEGMTMLIVTHEIQFSKEIADRIIYMDDGKIIEDGPPDEFYSNPKEDRTKYFLRSLQ